MKLPLIKFPRRVRIHGGEFDGSARAIHRSGEKYPLMTYEKALISQAELRIVRGSTNERKQMSTKTLRKRIALVTVAALGFGLLSSVAPASAAEGFDLVAVYENTTNPTAVAASTTTSTTYTAAVSVPSSVYKNTQSKYLRINANPEMVTAGRSIRVDRLVAPAAEAAATALPAALGVAAGTAQDTTGAEDKVRAFTTGFGAGASTVAVTAFAATTVATGGKTGFAAATAASTMYFHLALGDFDTTGAYTLRVYADNDSSGTFTTGDTSQNVSFTVGGTKSTDAVSLSKSSVIAGDVVTITVSSADADGYATHPSTDVVTLLNQFASCTTLGTRVSDTSITTVIDYIAGVSRAICVTGSGTAAAALVATGTATTAAKGAATLTHRTAVATAAKILKVASTNTTGIAYASTTEPTGITTAGGTDTITVDNAVTALSFVVTNNADQAGNYNVYEVSSSNTASVPNTAKTIARIGVDGLSTTFTITNAVPVAGDTYVVKVYGNADASTTAWATYTVVYSKAKPKLSIKTPTANPKVLTASTNTFSVKATDLFGRVLASQPVTMTVSGRNTLSQTVVTDATGFAAFTYTDAGTTATATADAVSFGATNAAGAATAATRTITYITAAIAVATVSLTADATTRTVDNVQSDAAFGYAGAGAVATLKATVRLATGAVAGSGVLVTFNGGAGDLFVDDVNTAVTDANGEAEADVYRNLVGTSTFTATSNGITSAATSGTKWSNTDSTDARYTTITSDPATAKSQGVIRVTAKVTDRWGNPVNNVSLSLTEEGAGRLYAGVAATGTTTTTGTYSWDLTSLAGETGSNVVTVLVTQASTQIANPAGYVGTAATTGVTAGTKSASTTVTFTADTSTSTADALLALATALGTRDQASATIDAAAEATDAANAATDAANAAAEAADAATAAAQDASDAVAALSAQVSEAIAGLKKQLVSLTNLVIKIQKKVKA